MIMNSEDALKLLQQQKIATNFQLSQSNCLLRTHVARGLEGEGWKMVYQNDGNEKYFYIGLKNWEGGGWEMVYQNDGNKEYLK